MANLIGLTVARNEKAGVDAQGKNGVIAIEKPLRFYASDQVHACNRKALRALGLGNRALKRVQSDAELRINLSALREASAADRAAVFSTGLRDRDGRNGQHACNRRSRSAGGVGEGGTPLVSC